MGAAEGIKAAEEDGEEENEVDAGSIGGALGAVIIVGLLAIGGMFDGGAVNELSEGEP
jgi:hypothetical protein